MCCAWIRFILSRLLLHHDPELMRTVQMWHRKAVLFAFKNQEPSPSLRFAECRNLSRTRRNIQRTKCTCSKKQTKLYGFNGVKSTLWNYKYDRRQRSPSLWSNYPRCPLPFVYMSSSVTKELTRPRAHPRPGLQHPPGNYAVFLGHVKPTSALHFILRGARVGWARWVQGGS